MRRRTSVASVVIAAVLGALLAASQASAALLEYRWNTTKHGNWSQDNLWDAHVAPASDPDNYLRFNARDTFSYISTNDLGDEFELNRFRTEGWVSPAYATEDQVYTVRGDSIKFVQGSGGEAPQLRLEMNNSPLYNATFNIETGVVLGADLTMNRSGSATHNLTGVISEAGGSRRITKADAGSITIGSALPNTFSGGAFIGGSGVVTAVGNSPLGSGKVEINNTAELRVLGTLSNTILDLNRGTLAGNGSIILSDTGDFAADISGNAVVSPGVADTVDVLHFTTGGDGSAGRVGFRNLSIWDIDLGPERMCDRLDINGSLFMGTSERPILNIRNPDAADGGSYTIATFTGTLQGSQAFSEELSILPDGYWLVYHPHSIEIVSPEPTSLSLLGLGALALLRRRRR